MKQGKQNNITFELLADYVDGLLDNATAQRIENAATEDEYYQHILEGIRHYYQEFGEDRSQLEQYLEDFQKRLEQKTVGGTARRRFITPRLMSIAAAVLLLVAIGFMLRNYFLPSSAESLMAQALENPYGSVYDINKSQTGDSIRAAINEFYQNGYYGDAAKVLEALSQIERSTEDLVMLGLSYLYQDPPRYNQATRVLNAAQLQQDNEAFLEQIQWYLAISYYMDDQQSKAEELFANIAGNEGHYRTMQAKEVLKAFK